MTLWEWSTVYAHHVIAAEEADDTPQAPTREQFEAALALTD